MERNIVRYSFLLIAAASSPWTKILQSALRSLGDVNVATKDDVLNEVLFHHYDVIIVDSQVVDDIVHLTAEVHCIDRTTRVIVATESPNWQMARAVFRAGGADCIVRSYDAQQLRQDIEQALDTPPPA